MTHDRPRGTAAATGRVVAVVMAALVAVGTVVFASIAGRGAPTAGAGPVRHGPPAPSPVVPGSYVALGDSFTSGPGVPAQLGPTTTPPAPATCLRSSANYPSLTARALRLRLVDMSCSGATTADMDRSQALGVPDQLSVLQRSTALVSVQIGGNDLGFSTLASTCASLTPWGPTRGGWSCRDRYMAGGVDQLAAVVRSVGTRVAAVLAAIRHRAPRARVFVVGYPDIVPPTGSGCWPALPFRAGDLDFLRGVASELDSALADAASAAGDHFVDMADPSETHSACASRDSRWVEPVLASSGTYPLHPDAAGMAGMARVLEAAMGSTGTR